MGFYANQLTATSLRATNTNCYYPLYAKALRFFYLMMKLEMLDEFQFFIIFFGYIHPLL